MDNQIVITPEEVRWFQEHQPEFLTSRYVDLYDKDGNPSRFRAYKMDEMLTKGFQLLGGVADVVAKEPEIVPEQRTMVRSTRLYKGGKVTVVSNDEPI